MMSTWVNGRQRRMGVDSNESDGLEVEGKRCTIVGPEVATMSLRRGRL